MIASADRGNSSATRPPGPDTVADQQVRQPVRRRRRVRRRSRAALAALTATACGVRATCAANSAGIDDAGSAGGSAPPGCRARPAARAPARRADPPTTTVARDRRSSPPAPARTGRPMSRRFRRRTRRCGTPPAADAGGRPGRAPALGKRERQIHPGGLGVERHGGDLDRPGPAPRGGVTQPGKFCQPSMTCTSGWWVRLRVGLSRSTRTSKGTSWCS